MEGRAENEEKGKDYKNIYKKVRGEEAKGKLVRATSLRMCCGHFLIKFLGKKTQNAPATAFLTQD